MLIPEGKYQVTLLHYYTLVVILDSLTYRVTTHRWYLMIVLAFPHVLSTSIVINSPAKGPIL